jgi:outer membrane immunogenic protein
MKSISTGIVVIASLLSTGAFAADLAPRPYTKAPPIADPGYNWTGFYVGINGGGAWGNSQWDGLNKFDVSGGMIGGTIGYNWQVGQIVVGAEGDIDWSGVKGNTGVLCGASCETRNKWLATIRGRLGYAFDRFLPYITAGLAAGDINATRPGFPGGSSSNAGWTVGAGLEFGIASNVSVKAEYLYVDLGDFNCGFNCGLVANGNVSYDANVFRGGLNIRF